MTFDTNFGITDAAVRQIQEIERANSGKLKVGLMWVDGNLNNGKVESQVGIGLFDEKEDDYSEITCCVGGISLIINILPIDFERFNGKKLDFIGNKFVVV
ncbi:MAG: hypothetical protein P4M09_02865 [Devosia sp.]|nr:hypothetical protein [Devosia sp.]